MKGYFKLCIGLVFVLILTGCFAEDYDVGVPTAHLNFDRLSFQLTEANVSWKTASENVQQTIEDMEEYASSLNEIKVPSGQAVSLDFKENKKNGGDIWTDAKITVTLLKDQKRIELALDDSGEFKFPTNEGNYILEVEFKSSAGMAQYAGNIVIEKTSKETKTMDGKLPEFSSMEMPSIKKVKVPGTEGAVFDHSYEEVCWNNCGNNNQYKYPDIHSGDVEIGDELLIDWLNMKPHPSEINFIYINTENRDYEVIKKDSIDITNTPLKIKIDKEKINSQYAVEFLWKNGREIIGRSMLNFRLE
mgnify:CR=1 FL=1